MSILIDRETKFVTIGLKGQLAQFHSFQCRDYGTLFMGGIAPGSGSKTFEGHPLFNTVYEAKKETNFNVAMIFLPSIYAADAILECVDSEIPLIICLSTGIPVHDMLKVKSILNKSKSKLIGPNCSGVITPGESRVGIMPGQIYMPGSVGVVSRSGTLAYEIVNQLTQLEIGQSTCVGIGGDPVLGMDFVDVLEMFEEDQQTDLVVLLGEIGGNYEMEAARWIKTNMTKPVLAYVAGSMMPKDRQIGHSGAIIYGINDSAEKKFEIFQECAVEIVRSPIKMAKKVKELMMNIE